VSYVPPAFTSLVHPFRVHELRAAYATEQLRPQQVIDLVLERIAARGEDAVWISRRSDHELRRQAAELDRIRRARGLAELPLFGVPCAVKDNIDVAGLATTAGCPAFSYQPTRNAYCAQRLVDAGANSPYGAPESALGGNLSPVVPVPAQRWRWPPAWSPSRWVPTPPVQDASRPR
jgi:allophanate hydrolase